MTRIGSLSARLRELEASQGYVTLDDGSKFKPQNSGISLLRVCLLAGRDLGREPVLSDFGPYEQEQLKHYAKWTPDPSRHGQLAAMVADTARGIIERSYR
jgi:hypothetical protein